MKLSDLYEMCVNIRDESDAESVDEKVYEVLRENVRIKYVKADEKLAIVRAVIEGCIKKIGAYEHVDWGLQKITFGIAVVGKLTDVELDAGNDDGTNYAVNYDMIHHVGLIDYLWKEAEKEMDEISDFLRLESMTVSDRNSMPAILEKRKTKEEVK